MNKLKKGILIILLISLNLFLVSCKGSREINTLGIVVTMGIDLEGEDIIITSEVINPTDLSSKVQGAEGKEPTKFVMSRGKTILEAMANASLTFDRILYPPHVHTVIIGEGIVKEGLYEYIDVLNRNNQIRETTILMIAKDTKAYEVMGIGSGLSTSPGKYLYELSQDNALTGKQRTVDISGFFKDLYRKDEGYILGVVEKIEKKSVDKEEAKKTLEVLSAEGGAVLKGKKLIGYFTGEEMMGFNFIVDEFKGGIISFDTKSSFRVFKNKTKLDIKLQGDKLHLFIDLKLRGTLEATREGVNFNDPMLIKQMEKSIGESIKKDISKTFKKAQNELEVDVFSIGDLVHRNYPDLWRQIEDDWTEVFKDLDYTIRVDANINDVGFTNTTTTKKIRKSIYEE